MVSSAACWSDEGSCKTGRFATALRQLSEMHYSEVAALQVEIASLQKRLGNPPNDKCGDVASASCNTGATGVASPTLAEEVLELATTDEVVRPESVAADKTRKAAPLESLSTRRSILQGAKKVGLANVVQKPAYKQNVIEYSSIYAFLVSVVRHHMFEATFCLLIFLNALVMAAESQYHGMDRAYDLRYPGFHVDAAQYWPGAASVLHICSWVFGVVFIIEILGKLLALKLNFFKDPWNWLDAIVCLVWVAAKIVAGLPVNSQMFRLARFFRLLRLLRLVRKIEGLDALFIMTTAIKSSFSVLFWTFVLLSMVQLMMALFLNQLLLEFYFTDDPDSMDKQHDVFTYFGTFTRAFFSMYELTLANWPPACRLLAQNVTEWFFLYGVLHKLSIGFAVVGVINSVFMQETFKVAAMDDVLMVRTKDRATKLHAQKMMSFLQEADCCDGDGHISKDEFFNILSDSQVKLWLSSMDLDTSDAETLFDLIDHSEDGLLSFQELVSGVARLKGAARSIDVVVLMRRHAELMARVETLIDKTTPRETPLYLERPSDALSRRGVVI
eukprot:TRINITY_DN32893_c0_g1_i1.p1 TRINITY_DN32893_c0_g1~~TRINITY_DN32893_c0_g1_i1.p1  ORF type:complete len:575 (+),score=99.80 TRINITY_DN32893_c0_g1_i1:57-1727(+)